MDEKIEEIRDLPLTFMNFLETFTLDSQKDDTNFDLNHSLKIFDLFLESNLMRLKNQNIALLFSGGLDSSLLAFKLNQLNIKFKPILVARSKEIDYTNALEVAKVLNLDLTVIEFDNTILETIIPKIMQTINTTEEKQINISVPFYLAADYLKSHNIPIAILGQGADELFCGYQRYVDYLRENPTIFKNYHLNDLKNNMKENYGRDQALFASKNILMSLPYLHQDIVKLTFSVPNDILIPPGSETLVKKNFLRLYAQMLGIDEKIILKKKTAIQFGSGSYRLLRKLAKEKGFTKDFAKKYGYLDNTQLYLDYLAQKSNVKNFDLQIEISEINSKNRRCS